VVEAEVSAELEVELADAVQFFCGVGESVMRQMSRYLANGGDGVVPRGPWRALRVGGVRVRVG
jgi:hypothetical protein